MHKLGEIFSWDAEGISVNREELKHHLRGMRLPLAPPQRKQGSSLRSVLSQFVHDGTLVRIGETKQYVCYAIVEELRDLAIAEYRGRTKDAVTYWKKTGRVQFRHNLWLQPIILEAMKKRNSLMTGQEIGLSLGKLLPTKAYGIRIRAHGGTYFVPEAGWPVLDRIQKAFSEVEATPKKIQIVRFDIANTKTNRNCIRAISQIDIAKRINDQIVSLILFLRVERKGAIRKTSVRHRVQRAQKFLETIELYEALLKTRLVRARRSLRYLRKLILQLQKLRAEQEIRRC